MSIFEKIKTAPNTNKSHNNEDQIPRKHWINLGIPVVLGEREVFINIPLALSADDIEKVIEREVKKLTNSNSDEFTAIQEGKLLLANGVKELFETLPEGQAILASKVENPLLQKLQIQFFKASDKELPSNAEEMRKGIFNAMLNS